MSKPKYTQLDGIVVEIGFEPSEMDPVNETYATVKILLKRTKLTESNETKEARVMELKREIMGKQLVIFVQ